MMPQYQECHHYSTVKHKSMKNEQKNVRFARILQFTGLQGAG